MFTKAKLTIGVSVALVGALAIVSIVAADATSTSGVTLGASCNSSVVANVVTWTVIPTGGTAPYHVVWSGDLIGGVTSTVAGATYASNGTRVANVLVTDSASSTAQASCSATVSSFVTPTPSPEPPVMPVHKINPPSLSIGPNGGFLGRGMTVTSVGAGTFQAQVWGITYTVNWSGSLSQFEFWFRFKKATSTPTVQLSVGDEVGVAGTVSSAAPLVVNATVVRDYSITTPRPIPFIPNPKDFENGKGNGTSTGEGNNGNNGDSQGRLNDLLNQLKNLQNLFHGHGSTSTGTSTNDH